MTTTDDPLLELLLPHIPADSLPSADTTSAYLARLTSLPLSAIQTTEPTSLSTTQHTLELSLQSLASRNHRTIIASSQHLSTLTSSVSTLSSSLQELKAALPDLDNALTDFSSTYSRESSTHLQERSQHQQLHTNLERLLDILHLPSLLHSLIAAQNYASALDTLAHVRRLRVLYPASPSVGSVHTACEGLQKTLTANLLSTLRGPLKLPVAMKTVGFLRRTLGGRGDDRDVRALFLVCRHAHLLSLLSALEPLRNLAAEDESAAGGVHTERFLKRWLELFREHSFGIVSMYRSIFPGSLSSSSTTTTTATATATAATAATAATRSVAGTPRPGHTRSSSSMSAVAVADGDPDSGPLPDPVVSYEATLVDMLACILREYLPKVVERGVRESLLTQVLYASGSLGRLGGEFAGVLAGVEGVFGLAGGGEDGDEEEEEERMAEAEKKREEEYVAVVARQKVLAGRLEAMAAAGRSSSPGLQ